MALSATSLTRHGLRDWLVQRVSAVYLFFYFIFLIYSIVQHAHDFIQWRAFWASPIWASLTMVACLQVALHAWIGIWTVTTDYLKPTALRLMVQMFVALLLLAWLAFSLWTLWGIH